MEKDLLSIVMVNYNHALFLREAIESVLAQTYKPWELIIIDDGSKDDSLEIISEYTNKYSSQIKLFVHEEHKNLGIAASYRLAIGLCGGEFIGFLEPDDIWTNINAEVKIKALLDNKSVGLVYSDVKAIGEQEIITMRSSVFKMYSQLPKDVPFEAFSRLLVINCVLPFSNIIVRKETVQELKFICKRKYGIWLDWFLWLQASLKTKFIFIPEKLILWRFYKKSYCTSFVLKKTILGMIYFEMGYRWMLFRQVILTANVSAGKKFKMTIMFSMGLMKRILLFIYNRVSWKKE